MVEFLMSSAIFLIIGAAVFSMMAETQRNSAYQTEIQAVLDNTRLAMALVEKYISQAGNDPKNIGLTGVTITSSTEVRLLSDLTGSAGAGNPDKGDPDGDTGDAGEDITIRYNSGQKSIELVTGGTTATLANYISAFSLAYYDAAGATTNSGAAVKKIQISLTGATTMQHPQTHKIFSMAMTSDVQLGTRQ